MAYTTQDVEKIEKAIKEGLLSVTTSDGRTTTFQNLSEMRKARHEMLEEIEASSGGRRRRRTFRIYQKGTGL